jgi:hypothetical protein
MSSKSQAGLHACFTYSLTQKMGIVCSSEMSVKFFQTTWHHIQGHIRIGLVFITSGLVFTNFVSSVWTHLYPANHVFLNCSTSDMNPCMSLTGSGMNCSVNWHQNLSKTCKQDSGPRKTLYDNIVTCMCDYRLGLDW